MSTLLRWTAGYLFLGFVFFGFYAAEEHCQGEAAPDIFDLAMCVLLWPICIAGGLGNWVHAFICRSHAPKEPPKP